MTTRTEITFPSGTGQDRATCSAWLYLPDRAAPAPIVVMGHGFGAIRDMGLDAFAERFVAAGFPCLVFDYRHFGASGGEPRQLLSVARQLEDWRAAIDCAKGLPEIDPARVVIWGSSFGGGHVIATAADVDVAGAIAQCPFTDGPASVLRIPPLISAKLTTLALRDVLAARRGEPAVMVPTVGEPGDTAMMTAPDVVPGYLPLVPEGAPFRNEVAARVVFDVLRYRPGRRAKDVTCPLHVTLCDDDSVAPARTASRQVAKAPRAEIVHRPVGHFDIYTGSVFEQVVGDQIGFLRRTVGS